MELPKVGSTILFNHYQPMLGNCINEVLANQGNGTGDKAFQYFSMERESKEADLHCIISCLIRGADDDR